MKTVEAGRGRRTTWPRLSSITIVLLIAGMAIGAGEPAAAGVAGDGVSGVAARGPEGGFGAAGVAPAAEPAALFRTSAGIVLAWATDVLPASFGMAAAGMAPVGAVPAAGATDGSVPAGGAALSPRATVIVGTGTGAARLGTPVQVPGATG